MARIVHIEDDPANRLLVRKLLVRAGHEVIEAEDGIAGVRVAVASKPELVLVDLTIPGLDGFEVALRLRAEPGFERVPIVAITAGTAARPPTLPFDTTPFKGTTSSPLAEYCAVPSTMPLGPPPTAS